MLDGYEKFKKDVYALTSIDLNCYKEKQMKRRIDTLITKNKIDSYNAYVEFIKKDKSKFEQFVNFLTINVSEFTEIRNSGGFWIRKCFLSWYSGLEKILRSGARRVRRAMNRIHWSWRCQSMCR